MMLTKAKIEELAKEVKDWARRYGKDFSIFYNGKRLLYPLLNLDHWEYAKRYEVEDDVNPRDYCQYFSDHFIMGMSYDGGVYDVINYGDYTRLEKVLEKYGLYLEHLDSCHCEFFPIGDMEVEYTELKARPKEYMLYGPGRCQERWNYDEVQYPLELDGVMGMWSEYSRILGKHEGACIIGEGIWFNYKGNKYKMHNQSIYQGDVHFLKGAEYAKKLLEKLGATDIYIDHGRLD